jgi:hypothetical protein
VLYNKNNGKYLQDVCVFIRTSKSKNRQEVGIQRDKLHVYRVAGKTVPRKRHFDRTHATQEHACD